MTRENASVSTRIRLARAGRKKRPYYQIVVADQRARRDGRFIERIGSYNPLLTENKSSVNVERATYWLDVGAQPSERVSRLLALQGIQHKALTLPVSSGEKPEPGKKAASKKAARAAPAEAAASEKAPAEAGASGEAPAEA